MRGEIPLRPRLPSDAGRALDPRAGAAAQAGQRPAAYFRDKYGVDILAALRGGAQRPAERRYLSEASDQTGGAARGTASSASTSCCPASSCRSTPASATRDGRVDRSDTECHRVAETPSGCVVGPSRRSHTRTWIDSTAVAREAAQPARRNGSGAEPRHTDGRGSIPGGTASGRPPGLLRRPAPSNRRQSALWLCVSVANYRAVGAASRSPGRLV